MALGKEVVRRAAGCTEARRFNVALRRQVEAARRSRSRNLDTVDLACRRLIAKAGSELQVRIWVDPAYPREGGYPFLFFDTMERMRPLRFQAERDYSVFVLLIFMDLREGTPPGDICRDIRGRYG